MYTRPWTPEEDRRLREAVLEGATQSEVAEEIGRTRAAVAQRARHLGIRWQMGAPVNPYRRSQILALLKLGLSHHKIGKCLGLRGCAQRTIARMARVGLLKRVHGGRYVRYVETTDKEMRRVSLKTQKGQAQAEVPTDQRKHSA